ncbi:hypothetical protein BDV98DRAFT_496179, partial [Pterulicium gracile]
VCREFIEALEACHLSTFAKFTGGCNKQKDLLNGCLRKERNARSAEHLEKSKVRNAHMKEVWREFHEDD